MAKWRWEDERRGIAGQLAVTHKRSRHEVKQGQRQQQADNEDDENPQLPPDGARRKVASAVSVTCRVSPSSDALVFAGLTMLGWVIIGWQGAERHCRGEAHDDDPEGWTMARAAA